MTIDNHSPDQEASAEPTPAIIVGIDWADKQHAFHLVAPDGSELADSFEQTPEAIEQTIHAWRKQSPGTKIEIAVEQSRGALINALLKYDDLTIYPINPAAASNYRGAFAHGGGKNDPVDARLLVQFLRHYRPQLRPLRRDEPLTRELAALCEDRRALVDQRTKLANRLTALLKCYFPCVLALGAAKPYAQFLIRFLRKYPTLADAQKAGRTRLRKFFFGVGAKAKAEQRLDTIMNAVPLSDDEVLLRTAARKAQAIAAQIDELN
jgi:transposase